MNRSSQVKPSLLGKMNERQVFQIIQTHGPSSRAEVTRYSGISAPTVSKAVASLLKTGMLEETEAPAPLRGRPAKQLRLASKKSQVLSVVIDTDQCTIAGAGLDGDVFEDRELQFATPGSYQELIETIAAHTVELSERRGLKTLGVGISVPGLIDYRESRCLLSPNLPITNGHTPGLDLQQRLGVDCPIFQEVHALCLAERCCGNAQELSDFCVVDVGAGVGMGMMSGGRLHTGVSGLTGEIGHITVDPAGRECGCGNYGCLETISSVSALAYQVREATGRELSNEEAVAAVLSGEVPLGDYVAKMNDMLAIGIAAFVNLFNPSTIFVHSPLHADSVALQGLVDAVAERSLAPNFGQCQLLPAQGTKLQGALAGIIQHLANSLAPALVDTGHFAAAPSSTTSDLQQIG